MTSAMHYGHTDSPGSKKALLVKTRMTTSISSEPQKNRELEYVQADLKSIS